MPADGAYSLRTALLGLLAVVMGSLPAFGATNTPKRLLILHSATAHETAGRLQENGARQALQEAGLLRPGRMAINVHAMAALPETDSAQALAGRIGKAISRIARFQPDVILTIGDVAFASVALPLARTPVSIVFSGLRGQPETHNRFIRFMKTRGRPGYNITGVYEKRHIRQAIELLSRLTDLKKVRMVYDQTGPGRIIAEQVTLELESAPSLPYGTDRVELASWEAFQLEILAINRSPEIGAFFLGALSLKDAAGHTRTTQEITDYAIHHATKPAIGVDAVSIGRGLYGGTAVDDFAMGYQAGEKVAAIVNGAEAGGLPIQDAQTVTLIFNLVRCQTLGLQIPSEILLAADEIVSP